ncbi:MAG: hypothetical protein NPIRA01_16080 [Nitrospirales bacterium]|nr:MAG: hypothetical protein NPIRA01_16080 [Nitrospirales bacterium]
MTWYLSLNQTPDKDHIVLRNDDIVLLVVNDQNNVIEYSVFGEERWMWRLTE